MKNVSWKKIAYSLLTIILLFFGYDTLPIFDSSENLNRSEGNKEQLVEYDQSFDTLQEVVDYLYLYDELPPNYISKKEARALGWEAREGNLWEVAPDMSIGGDYFGNFEGLLPEKANRNYHEADINYDGGYRGAERLIYSNDDLYFYTENHYESFEKIEPTVDNDENSKN